MSELKGVCTPVCTTFTEDGSKIDFDAFAKHLDQMIENKVDIIAVAGGTGEFPFLSPTEKMELAEFSVKHVNRRAKVLVQTSSTRTEEAVEMSIHAQSIGADAVLVLPPFFEGPNMEGVFEHYKKVNDAISIPIMAYNIPQFSGIDVTPEFYARLSKELENVKYIKDSTGDLLRIHKLLDNGANVFCGADHIMFESMVAGAPGVFWGGSNAFPDKATEMFRLVQAGNITEASTIWKVVAPLCIYFWTINYNPGVKAATNLLGGNVGLCRRPQQPLTADEAAQLEVAIKGLV